MEMVQTIVPCTNITATNILVLAHQETYLEHVCPLTLMTSKK
jgi:hypothetical protein